MVVHRGGDIASDIAGIEVVSRTDSRDGIDSRDIIQASRQTGNTNLDLSGTAGDNEIAARRSEADSSQVLVRSPHHRCERSNSPNMVSNQVKISGMSRTEINIVIDKRSCPLSIVENP